MVHCVCSHRHVILLLPAKFSSKQTKDVGVIYDAISIFHDGGHGVGNLLPGSGLVTALI